jgi:hypothetical protein
MREILALRSAEAEEDYGEYTVADVLPYKEEDIAGDRGGEYSRLRESMMTRGQTAPVNIYAGTLGDGHHRVALAVELGWTSMRYTDAPSEHPTDDLDYDQAAAAREGRPR